MAAATHPISVYSPSLAHSLKRGCANCGSDIFAMEDVTANAGVGEGIYLQCIACGHTALVTFLTMGATDVYGA